VRSFPTRKAHRGQSGILAERDATRLLHQQPDTTIELELVVYFDDVLVAEFAKERNFSAKAIVVLGVAGDLQRLRLAVTLDGERDGRGTTTQNVPGP
jgi:hypothetical protein